MNSKELDHLHKLIEKLRKVALYFAIAAFVIGVVTGFLFERFIFKV